MGCVVSAAGGRDFPPAAGEQRFSVVGPFPESRGVALCIPYLILVQTDDYYVQKTESFPPVANKRRTEHLFKIGNPRAQT